MRDLLATVTEREVLVEGLGTFRVRPPTVREALCVMATAERFDEDSWGLLRDECAGWLRPRMHSYLFAEDSPKTKVVQFLLGLLSLGITSKRHESDEKEVKRRARKQSWAEIIAEYASAYHLPPQGVLETPWPFFVAMSAQIPVQHARQMIRDAQWYAGAKLGKLDGVMKQAGYTPEKVEEPPHMNEEWEEEQLEKVRRLRQKQGRA